MKMISGTLFTLAALFIASSPVGAVVRGSGGAPDATAPSASTPGSIARGGTIDAVNVQNSTITVDGATYRFHAGIVKVHSEDPSTPAANALNLRKGMQIRFTTVKETGGSSEKVTEIWVTKPRGGSQPK